ncbi:DUF1223 domain-containing protein [Rhizobium sp. C4]|uniref:DUF1223 domain-containing protein n=1 Tax=Rhizobium sp. C4 TaxID=1349800 RepID=UPI001E2D049B|nr:DUF1223 domain-containing protein [Rhizobium sp. C4]MCD2174512.1 DUF1223 domain-containing protein [Rhizobium sp. C4]
MNRLVLLIAVSILPLAAAQAEDTGAPKGVVELFTSQGCNSCPPADAVLGELAHRGDLLALSYHVDYWNYLGWADTLSSKQNTGRQYGYAATMSRSNVYTPQAVLNGRTDVNGADKGAIETGLKKLEGAGQGLSIPIQASVNGKEMDISVGAGKGSGDVVIAYFKRKQTVPITRGENSGKTITYLNSVTEVETVGMWKGDALQLKLPVSVMDMREYDGCAVLLQQTGPNGEPGPILGAAGVMAWTQ